MIKIQNTLSGQKEEFAPRKEGRVNMFVCGPTVYDYIHIGNARTFVFFDVVAKYLRYRGYDVNYIQNITDIDNKIIERAQKAGVDPLEYAKKYSDIFREDMKALDVTSPEYKNATDHIPEVIKQVQTLLNKGNAYVIENDGIYFDLSTFPDYGKLSGRTAGMADDAVSRIDDSDKKRNRGDFALWKHPNSTPPPNGSGNPNVPIRINGEPMWWNKDLGWGRPGWHIEDTTITEKYFGPQYDIHGGGQDLIFPHHEAEVTQQCAAANIKPKDFVKYWMHVAFVVNSVKSSDYHGAGKKQKMSKSLGNFETANELIKKHPKEALRFYLLSAHYRSPLDFSEKALKQAEAGVSRISEFKHKLELAKGGKEKETKNIEKARKEFSKAMDDDFNTPQALSSVFDLIRNLNIYITRDFLDKSSIESLKVFFAEIDSVLGIVPTKQEKIPDEVLKLVETREKLREEKNWPEADKIRAQIEDLGYTIEDTVYGPLVVKK
ncbi:MAG: cysteine--tRNA ligase [Candidatus Yanofskybacteria bacterium]|nr:cysteine--tRNA ligase [Candidatus Yanofskybacteria bacterium]